MTVEYFQYRKTESMSCFMAMVCKNILRVMMGNKYEGEMFISGNYNHLFRYNKHNKTNLWSFIKNSNREVASSLVFV